MADSQVQKPLPAIPRTRAAGNTTLTIDARDHLCKFIRHCLEEEDKEGLLRAQEDSLVYELEGALDDLGDSFARGNWLLGLKKARKIRKIRKDNARVLQELSEDAEGSVKDKKKKKKGKDANVAKESSHESERTERTSHNSCSTVPSITLEPELALQHLRDLVAQANVPSPKPSPKHLLISIAPFRTASVIGSSANSQGSSILCVFVPGTFTLPQASGTSATDENLDPPVILCGLDNWDPESKLTGDSVMRLVGGSFYFNGVQSLAQHRILCQVLRITVYFRLSIILEQHFLANSAVELIFPSAAPVVESPPPLTSPPTSPPNTPNTPTSDPKSRNRNSFIPSGLFGFLSKRTTDLVHRASLSSRKRDSADISPPATASNLSSNSPTSAESSRFHPFSFMPSPKGIASKPTPPAPDDSPPLSAALERVRKSSIFYSTSPGVRFEPPSLLVKLAGKEKENPNRRLMGDEKTGLTSIIGWEGRNARGKGMTGTAGFVRQQEISVLYSQHVPSTSLDPLSETTDTSEAPSRTPSTALEPPPRLSTCDRPHWITYRYYDHRDGEDVTLGEAIMDWCQRTGDSCDIPACEFKRGQHERRFIHGSVRVVVTTDTHVRTAIDLDIDRLEVWTSCKVCGAKSIYESMSDGTYLLSFAKFLELLIYSPAICTLTPTLCEHTPPPPQPWTGDDYPLPQSRLNIVRHFAYHDNSVSFSLSNVKDVFEVRVPRLQMIRHYNGGDKATTKLAKLAADQHTAEEILVDEDKKVLRKEIAHWWQGVSERIDELELEFADQDDESIRKALPRLPSVDDAYDITPTPTRFLKRQDSGLPVTDSPSTPHEGKTGYFDTKNSKPVPGPSLNTPTVKGPSDPAVLLSSIRHSFQRKEQSLYAQLARTPVASLNDVRRSFYTDARGASKRLSAWQKKHVLNDSKSSHADDQLKVHEPEWWAKTCHAVPGGNVIVREDDWGSIIAFTLSSSDYKDELANMTFARALSPTQSTGMTPMASPALSTTSGSFFSSHNPLNIFVSPTPEKLDPDEDGVVWHEAEPCSAVISRKQHPRDPTSILSIREVLRHRTPDITNGSQSSIFSHLTNGSSKLPDLPLSTWSKPASVQVSKAEADGSFGGLPEKSDTVGQILQELDTSSRRSSFSGSYVSSAADLQAHIRRGRASSILSKDSDSTIGPDDDIVHLRHSSSNPPTPPKKEPADTDAISESHDSPLSPSNIATTLTSGISNAMRFVMKGGEGLTSPGIPGLRRHHSLLSVEGKIDSRPHIKYDWTIGKRLKFSCTAYYAKQFDALRKRCGIDDVFLRSLGRSSNWAAEGGKSKSNFWKTSDDRFIIKTLVNAWNVADLQVLIELAPSYFQHMDSTASKATVLAKLLGFYTVEVRNLESGSVQSKADLLVMENLFYKQNIAKTFDLKGIQGRKVKASGNEKAEKKTTTLFDGEWIEGQERTLTLVRPHSKVVLHEAIKSDAEFLSQSNIMDYSLLLGIDVEKKEIACGLVDTIGSYTFAKTLEYKAKHNLNTGKEVTVIPPTEYRDRFVSALERYFLACPDKWSRPLDHLKEVSDPSLLPSVL